MLIVVVKTGTALSAIFDGRNMLQSADGIHAETLPEIPEVETVRRSLDPFLTQGAHRGP